MTLYARADAAADREPDTCPSTVATSSLNECPVSRPSLNQPIASTPGGEDACRRRRAASAAFIDRRLQELGAARVPVAVLDRRPGLHQADRQQAEQRPSRSRPTLIAQNANVERAAPSTPASGRSARRQKSISPMPSMP